MAREDREDIRDSQQTGLDQVTPTPPLTAHSDGISLSLDIKAQSCSNTNQQSHCHSKRCLSFKISQKNNIKLNINHVQEAKSGSTFCAQRYTELERSKNASLGSVRKHKICI